MTEKKSCKCADKIKDLKNEINRLTEEKTNFEIISKSHKELNGDLRKEIAKLQEEKKQLEVKTQKHFEEFRNKGDL